MSNNEMLSQIDNNNNDNNIIKFQRKTHEYFSRRPPFEKFYIDSEKELNKFYSIFSNAINLDQQYLDNNTVFIQVKQASSGSIKWELSSVTFNNNNVNLNIVCPHSLANRCFTCDMAFWYFVAVIPNNMLKNLNLIGWKKPSEI
ncbi:hypothetical protein BCR32DRAFT_325434 [Anaeromyces robustus]|uniref:Uncharacterized protein n=1 Tax=Anaeromyces robustus TaxID=1754192 RepID=A0A1Y1XJD3_9FUNG|nr:hypothetical protein BCR32DRAFT_325913 [Anaeromyces robustus]ORX85484.1 hypothetical protein BCR32DRAFT_325434 [Anaeromyces robustus]|eukprot:ORX84509.1 hypothetical protein BCR32DRAFT_325913 [Anaeromyces robustus]